MSPSNFFTYIRQQSQKDDNLIPHKATSIHKKPIKNCAGTNNNEKETVPSFQSHYNQIKGCNNHGQSSKEFAL